MRAARVGVVARVKRPVLLAMQQIFAIQKVGEAKGEREAKGRSQNILGDLLEDYIRDTFETLFPALAWSDFCRAVRRGKRVRLVDYLSKGETQ